MNARALLFYLMMIVPALAQGFAGLGSNADGFALPQPGHRLEFPADHGAHPDFRIEWWYVTANLKGEDGKDYGIQWTLFRSALAPNEAKGWQSPQLWMGHAALTTAERHFVAERLARGGIGQAGVTLQPFSGFIDDWQMRSAAKPGSDPISAVSLSARGADFSYSLSLDADRPLILQGENGYSVKSAEGQASYYYSQPFYKVQGTLTLPAGNVAVTGQAWLDREWSSQPLSPGQTGWDWFSLHFDTGEKMMAYRLRDAGEGYTFATWIDASGKPEAKGPGFVRLTPLETDTVAGRKIPVRWRVEFPEKGVDITTEPLNRQAWMATQFPYWEGPVSISGTKTGRGYVEMTGYE